MYTFGPYTVSQFLVPPASIQVTVSPGAQFLRINNNSPYQLDVQLGGMSNITYPEMQLEDIRLSDQFNGVITIVPKMNISSSKQATSNTLWLNVYYPGELARPQLLQLLQTAVNPTATGDPVYVAHFGVGSSVHVVQTLNIFNPSNSGVIGIFHSASVFSDTPDTCQCIMSIIPAPDLNLATPVGIASHVVVSPGTVPVPSVMHATFDDVAVGHGGNVMDNQLIGTPVPNASIPTYRWPYEMIAFPDVVYLFPGNNLLIVASDLNSSSGFPVELQAKWTERLATPPQFLVAGMTNVATSLVNQGNPPGQTFILSTVQGLLGNAFNFFNDGSGLWQVDQGGTNHAVIKTNTAGNPLVLGQTGDQTEVNGILLVDQTAIIQGDVTINGAGTGLTVANNELISGILNVTGATNLTGLLTAVAATFTGQVQPNQAGAVTNGSVSGTLTFFTPVWGTGLKIFVISMVNYQSVNTPTLLFPSAAVNMFCFAGNIGTQTFQFFNGGSGLTARHLLTVGAANSAGTDEPVTAIHSLNFATQTGTMDRIICGAQSAAANNIIIGIGV